ncbi:MAG TPA: S8 family serine peptidase [Gaiellaceae bacterium]
MSKLNERGAHSERGSALWGTGGRGGDRSSVLWGKGGRGMVVTLVLAFALAAPLAATAGNGNAQSAPVANNFIAPSLLQAKGQVDVVISYQPSLDSSGQGASLLDSRLKGMGVFQNMQRLGLINGYHGTVPAAQLKKLADVPGVSVTPDATVQVSGSVSSTTMSSTQLWPYESGNADMWAGDQLLYNGKLPTIAVVDSGIQPRADFGTRVVASVNLSTLTGNTSMDDQRGHGTFVAGIAAGAASGLAGAAPTAPLVSIKVMDQNGQAKTSDIINACQWILDHQAQYNIRVANFSLHSSYATNFYRDPLDQAVEKLWFNGVVVVAAAGNYGVSNTTPSGVIYSPGNDPFVITVGAVDLGNSSRNNDDQAAPWSAWGYTNDGFYKPEISAPGRYMVGPVPAGSTLTVQKASNMVGTDRIQLSGTSFAAPVVAGTVAQMLARHPGWTPDQVKGALMKTARAVHIGNPRSAGLGELTASRAAALLGTPPNANLALDQYVKPALTGASGLAFDSMSWASAAKASSAWNAMSWASQSWSDMSWSDQSWATMSWSDMSWSDMSWSDMSWSDMSWSDVSQEDAAEGDDIAGTQGYVATPTEVQSAATDPDQVTVDVLPVDPAATDTSSSAATPTTATTP